MHTLCHVAMYGKHLHIQQSVVVVYHFLLVVSFLIEDHHHDPIKQNILVSKVKCILSLILESIFLNSSMYQRVFP